MAERCHWVLWGSAGHAKVLADAIGRLGGQVIALVDNDPGAVAAVAGAPLLAGEQGLRAWLASRGGAARLRGSVAVGGGRGRDRLALTALLRSLGIDAPPIVHPTATVADGCTIGSGCHLLANSVVSAAASLGEACIVNHGATVDHECVLADGVHVGPGATLAGCVDVGPCAFIGAGATVLPRLRIGADATIGAGAVVTRDVAAGTVVVGVPAREIQRRNRA